MTRGTTSTHSVYCLVKAPGPYIGLLIPVTVSGVISITDLWPSDLGKLQVTEPMNICPLITSLSSSASLFPALLLLNDSATSYQETDCRFLPQLSDLC